MSITTHRHLRTISLVSAALLAMVACGGSDSSSPVGPSPTGPGSSAPPAMAGASVTGTVSSGAVAQVRTLGVGLGGVTVSVAGTDLSTTTGSGGAFALHGVPPGLVRLLFQGSGASGTLELNDVGETEEISLSVVVSGSTIELESQERVTGSQAQLEGKVDAADYVSRTLLVGATTVVVPEDIPITNGYRELELEDVIVGARIHVKGSLSGDTLTATRIIVQQTGLETVKLSGVISDVGGVCPEVTFQFGSLVVAVNSSTIYVQGTCNSLEGGTTVEVKGFRRVDGSILATMVKFKSGGDDDDDDDGPGGQAVEVAGTISGLSGPCPARKFFVDGREVQTTGATTFLTPCATLANGQTVQVRGKSTGNGKIIASEVK